MSKVGNNNFISNSFNKISYLFSNVAYNIFYTEYKTQIEQIRKEFFNGEIKKAHEYLQSAKEEKSANKKARYDFLLLETEFLFHLHNYEEVKKNLSYLEENLSDFLNQDFYQLQISIYALDGDRDNFNQISIKLQKEFSSNQSNEYFEIVFLLNSGKIKEAKCLYESYLQNVSDNKLLYIGGLIYANHHLQTQSDEDYDNADVYYQKFLEEKTPTFFEKLEISKFYSRTALNKLLLNHVDVLYKEYLENTAELLTSIKDSFHYFTKAQRIALENHYLHCLYLSNKESFIDYHMQVNEDELDIINFGFKHFEIEKCKDNQTIESRIISKNEIELLIHYLSMMVLINPNRVIDFLNENKNYLDNEIITNIHLDATIRTEKNITDNDYNELENKKENSIVSYISYLEAKKIKSLEVSNNELDTLLKMLDNASIQEIIVVKTIRILSQNSKQKKYLDLALKYKNQFQNIISETLNICENDRNLLITDFDKFVENIDHPNFSIKIANIYRSYPSLRKAYKYYKVAWEHFDFLQKDKIEFASHILHYCSLPYYFQNTNTIDLEQDGVYKGYLEEQYSLLNIEQTFFLSFYSIVVEESYENGFFNINRKLLAMNINELSNDEVELLSKLYFYSIVNHLDEEHNIKTNLSLKANNEYYVSNKLFSDIHDTHIIKLKKQDEFDLLLFNQNVEKTSIFHTIISKLIYSLQSNNFQTVISTEEDPLSGIREMLHENTHQGIQKFKDYSEGGIISFYNLANGDYKNYFKVIGTFLNVDKYNFHSGNNNRLPYEVNKILTFSSIVFLNSINRLDTVLDREDVYIQKTTINWLVGLIKELDTSDEIFTVYSDGENLLKNISNKADIEKDKQYLLDLANKIIASKRVINDTDEVLPIKESEQMIAPHIGQQEYRALAYSYNHNFQIISEDRIISFLFDNMSLNTLMVSNSISLLSNKLEMNDLFELYKELDEKNYAYLFNENAINSLLQKLIFEDPIYLLQWHKKKYSNFQLEELLHIVKKYGWLEWIEKYYRDNYVLKPPKTYVQERTYITSNIEYIFELLGIQIAKKL